jgi:hypothetical protein
MQKVVYICDHCNKIIGDVIHITLEIKQGYSGLSIPPEVSVLDRWIVEPKISGFKQFHIGCIEKYFNKLAKPYLITK